MKRFLLLAIMIVLVFGSSAILTETLAARVSSMSANAVDVEGVTIEHQRTAFLKPGYVFRRESRSSVSVLKTVREAILQTGTLTCIRADKRACTVEFNRDIAKCSSSCYFVGVRGAPLAQ
ncbi:MAG TPA: hypothetical protein VM095_21525 [Pyrinomonadaceae bacterium]|nr:hypothetical protein [Pyrinomonadaceae bacterium]